MGYQKHEGLDRAIDNWRTYLENTGHKPVGVGVGVAPVPHVQASFTADDDGEENARRLSIELRTFGMFDVFVGAPIDNSIEPAWIVIGYVREGFR
jgi:hypothetical protein